MDNLELIFDEFVAEALKGKIETDPFIYNTKFKTVYGNEEYTGNMLCLKIADKKEFLSLLAKYLLQLKKYRNIDLDHNTIKEAITLLFSNITYSEFANPTQYIQKYIAFYDNCLQDQTINGFSSFNANQIFLRKNKNRKHKIDELIYSHDDMKELEIMQREYYEGLVGANNRNVDYWNSDIVTINSMQSLRQETPYCFETAFTKTYKDELLNYRLPKISYGISDNICYIYAVQNENVKTAQSDNNKKYGNMINRCLYELNDGVFENETDEYKAYKEGKSDYYPENISDVSPSAILALTIFLNCLNKEKISKIVIVPFLPVRYSAKEKANYNKLQFMSKKTEIDFMAKVELFKKMKIEHNMLQDNLTNKFVRNFMRLKYHFNNLKVLNIPFDSEELVYLNLDDFTTSNNEILSEIIEKMGELKRDKNL